MMEQNYKTFCALKEIVSNGHAAKSSLTPMSRCAHVIHVWFEQMIDADFDIKAKTMQILETTGYAESRPAKMDMDDFLKWVA